MERKKSIKSIDSFSANKCKNNLTRKSDGIRVVKRHKIVNSRVSDKQINKNRHFIDGASSWNLEKETNKKLYTEAQDFKKENKRVFPFKIWKFSMVGAMLFGMVTMGLIYKNLGQTVEASDDVVEIEETETDAKEVIEDKIVLKQKEDVGVEEYGGKENEIKEDIRYGELPLPDDGKSDEQLAFEKRAKEIVKGYPIEKMLPYIFKQDIEVAAYLIAISKQESAWGKRKPVLNGKECYNYWGYRGKREKMGSGGHTCFNSREDAVETVGKRIHDLVYKYDRKTPEKMIVWKCGNSCEGHSDEGVNRWIKTIKTYRDDLLRK